MIASDSAISDGGTPKSEVFRMRKLPFRAGADAIRAKLNGVSAQPLNFHGSPSCLGAVAQHYLNMSCNFGGRGMCAQASIPAARPG